MSNSEICYLRLGSLYHPAVDRRNLLVKCFQMMPLGNLISCFTFTSDIIINIDSHCGH